MDGGGLGFKDRMIVLPFMILPSVGTRSYRIMETTFAWAGPFPSVEAGHFRER